VSLAGAGPGGGLRVLVTFADGAIVDKWLCITVEANANTGLAQDQVYYFASVVGETGAAFAGQGEYFGRDAADFRAIVGAGLNRPAGAGDRHDVNDNGQADIFDIQSIAIAGVRPIVLPVITAPPSPAGSMLASAAMAAPLPLPVLLEESSVQRTQWKSKDAAFGQWSTPERGNGPFVPLMAAGKPFGAPTLGDDQSVADLVNPAAYRPSLRDLVLESFARLT
jgi:hypothetical protein